MNDWATEEIVKQYMKNKRKHHYRHGWLDVPERYKYLKNNSDKRNPNGSRRKKGLGAVETGEVGAKNPQGQRGTMEGGAENN
jgi:hypothetical protein